MCGSSIKPRKGSVVRRGCRKYDVRAKLKEERLEGHRCHEKSMTSLISTTLTHGANTTSSACRYASGTSASIASNIGTCTRFKSDTITDAKIVNLDANYDNDQISQKLLVR
jgi:hypothetical protein